MNFDCNDKFPGTVLNNVRLAPCSRVIILPKSVVPKLPFGGTTVSESEYQQGHGADGV